jgi:peptidyl-prolyl cis-trans isomerase D
MMQAFRNAAKPVVYVITITFLGWMIFNLSGISGQGGLFTKTSVGSINGTAVDARVYQQAVQNAITERQRTTGTSLGLEDVEQVRNQVWEQFIQNAVIGDEIAKYHIGVTTDQVADWIRNVPPQDLQALPDFQTEGHFDLAKYQRWLASPIGQQYIPMLEQQARDDLLRTKLFTDITSDIYLSDAALWERYRDVNEKVSMSLTAIIGRNAVPDSAVPVSDAEVEAYYRSHLKEFSRPRAAFMSFVAVPRLLDASDSAAALARAEDLRKQIIGGLAFADVAKRESSDTTSAKNGGDLGTFAKGKMVAEFDKAVFSLPLNTVSEPVKTGFGYHLIEVTKRSGDSATARHILIPFELAGAHRTQVDAATDSLQRLGAARLDPAALDTVARALHLPVGHTGPVQEGSRVLVGTYVVPDAGVWAFQAKLGETSDVIEGEAAEYVFRLDSIQPAGTPALAQIRTGVSVVVRDSKKDEKAKAIAADLESRIAKGQSLADASKALNLPNKTFPLFSRVTPPLTTPKLVGAAFGLPKGQVSTPIDTPDGIYVIQVLEHQMADSADFEKNKIRNRGDMIQSVKQDRVRTYVTALRTDAKIVDDRNALRKTNAEAEAAAPPQPGSSN